MLQAAAHGQTVCEGKSPPSDEDLEQIHLINLDNDKAVRVGATCNMQELCVTHPASFIEGVCLTTHASAHHFNSDGVKLIELAF